ncbi:uracil-DNA glycosylase [Candidatus Laterigemmans baculatus]|uniref:uracil-DNA glycosylase n=1 Tax=Candidatus Laterigemmans baculatus TaxID=2770505 RepID=UPI0013D994BC|nr:uracil-DNA glycosylase [Candidatus Laterigemmans baculatus]
MSSAPETVDPSEFGFEDAAELQAATAGLLAHLGRIGLTHLPSAAAVANAGLPLLLETAPTPPAPTSTVDAARPDAARPDAAPSTRPSPAAPQVARPVNVREPTAAAPRGRLAPAAAVLDGPENYARPRLPVVNAQAELAALSSEVSFCTRCPALVQSRRQTVFGEGNPAPRVCFFGEAPGADEDRSGRPFVGRAGELLTKMIEACTFQREEVYILNTIKCRPPGNRNPQLDEVEHCRGYFEQQFEILQPEYIVCLGLISARALLHTTASVGRLRGVFHRYRSSKVLVTYHPAYLLRNPEAKRAAWEDLQLMLRDMGIDPKAPRKR